MLSDEQVDRYSRQILLSEIGGRGQERLLRSSVRLHVADPGCDDAVAAAEICGLHLAVAGVAKIGIDPRSAAATRLLSNLTRIVAHRTGDARVEPLEAGEDLLVSFGIPPTPAESSAAVVALLRGSRLALREFAEGPSCLPCLTALERAIGGDHGVAPAAATPLLAGMVATSALRILLGLDPFSTRTLVFDLALAAPLEVSSSDPVHDCKTAQRPDS